MDKFRLESGMWREDPSESGKMPKIESAERPRIYIARDQK